MVSVIICTYNKARYLDLTLAGYQIQTYKDFEIVIIDDGSIDNTLDIINKYCDILDIKYHKQENMGIAYSRNTAIEIAKGEYIIITDDDRIPDKDFVYEHKLTLDKKGKVVSIGKQGVILSIFNPDLSFAFTAEMNLYDKYPFLLSSDEIQLFESSDVVDDFLKLIKKYFLNFSENDLFLRLLNVYGEDLKDCVLAWSKAYGGNIAFNRNYLKDETKYDAFYKGYGCEDIDFSYQLYLQGYGFCLTKNAVNYHQLHKRSVNQNRDQYKNFDYFYNKYPHLEVYMMKMYWRNIFYMEKANDFIVLIKDNKDILMPRIYDYLTRIEKLNIQEE